MRRARRTDPDTSQDAAKALEGSLNIVQRDVLRFLKSRRFHGATDEEIESAFAFDYRLTTARKRRTELFQKGLVFDSGRRDRKDGGRSKIVWVHYNFMPMVRSA